MFSFLRSLLIVFQGGFTSLHSTSSVQGFLFRASLPTFVVGGGVLDDSYFNRSEVES
jgi:hypothetical protein